VSVLFASLLGLLFGSFANVYFFRVPQELSFIRPRSFCPACERPLLWHDNVPILSYLILGGKCRSCGARIPIRYPAVELALGIFFGCAAFKLRGAPVPVCAAFLFYVLIIFLIGGIDLATFFKNEKKYGIIPDPLTLSLAVSGAAFSAFNPYQRMDPWAGLLHGAAVAAMMSVFRWGAGKLAKREALGLGDVKMMAGVGVWLGWNGALAALIAGSVLGTFVSLPMLLSKKAGWKTEVPFGPFLSIGALGAFFFL